MADDRWFTLQGSSSCHWRNWRQSGYGTPKRGLNTNLHLAVDAHGMPIRFVITKGTTHDCKKTIELISDLDAEALLADGGYESDEIVAYTTSRGMVVVIPPKKNRKLQRTYDKYIYKLRHLVENAFLKLKRWRGVATR